MGPSRGRGKSWSSWDQRSRISRRPGPVRTERSWWSTWENSTSTSLLASVFPRRDGGASDILQQQTVHGVQACHQSPHHGRQSRASAGLQKWRVQHQDYQRGEKRILMKFLIQSVREEDVAVDWDKTFRAYLKQQKFMFYLASTKKLLSSLSLVNVRHGELMQDLLYNLTRTWGFLLTVCSIRSVQASHQMLSPAGPRWHSHQHDRGRGGSCLHSSRSPSPSCHGSGQPPPGAGLQV